MKENEWFRTKISLDPERRIYYVCEYRDDDGSWNEIESTWRDSRRDGAVYPSRPEEYVGYLMQIRTDRDANVGKYPKEARWHEFHAFCTSIVNHWEEYIRRLEKECEELRLNKK